MLKAQAGTRAEPSRAEDSGGWGERGGRALLLDHCCQVNQQFDKSVPTGTRTRPAPPTRPPSGNLATSEREIRFLRRRSASKPPHNNDPRQQSAETLTGLLGLRPRDSRFAQGEEGRRLLRTTSVSDGPHRQPLLIATTRKWRQIQAANEGAILLRSPSSAIGRGRGLVTDVRCL